MGAAALLLLASCTKDKFSFNPPVTNTTSYEEEKKGEFATAFVKKYGEVSANKTWDLTDISASKTRAGGDIISTRKVQGLQFDLSYEVKNGKLNSTIKADSKNKALYDYIKTALPEGQTHKGEPVVLTAPSNSFTIYPVSAEGQWTHDLYVKVGDDAPVCLYTKDWTDYSHGYVNGEGTAGRWEYGWFEQKFKITRYAEMPGLYVEAPVGTPVEIYLSNVKAGNSRKPSAGTFNGQAIYVDCNVKPEGIDLHPNAVIKYVGIEDNLQGDKDYNDVVLAIVGNPSVPQELKVEDDEYDVTTSITKRYMVEDLGSTDDFDFNDIVFDVTETITNHYKRTKTNGEVTANELVKTESVQKAVLRHLGGILPFQLTIGDTELEERQGVLGQDLEEEHTVTGWNPDENNVSVKVKHSANNGVIVNIPFPKAGEIPMIIATPQSWNWMDERKSVPSEWFYTDF